MVTIFGVGGDNKEKKKSKTTAKKTHRKTKKNNKDKTVDNPASTAEEGTKKRGVGTRKKTASRETAQSTAVGSSARGTNKKKEKGSKKKKNTRGTTEESEAPAGLNDEANKMLKGMVPTTPESPATPPPPPNAGALPTEDETTTMRVALVAPPAVDPCMLEQSSQKPKVAPAAPTPHEKSIKAAPINTAPTPNSTVSQADRWTGEETARCWLEKVSFEKTKMEFEKVQTMTANVAGECKKWKANAKLNQSADDYPALDSNLATMDNVYVNMSKLELPNLRGMFIGQIPVKGNEESFWKVIFDKRITNMQIIASPGEPIDFFPTQAGVHVYHGTMFVNNRRVETVNEDVARFAMEVLPDGCSNSIICNITIIKNWNIDSVHAKQAIVIKECIDLINFLVAQPKDENAIVISKHGAGRSGYLVALAVAIQSMDKKTEPSIYDIVKGIRAQRPKAVETVTQYVSIYTSMFYYIKKKIARTDGGVDKKTVVEATDPICRKSINLTTLFANALIAEVNAGKSTMTVLK